MLQSVPIWVRIVPASFCRRKYALVSLLPSTSPLDLLNPITKHADARESACSPLGAITVTWH